MRRYYIEFVWHGSCDGIVLQSVWFNSEGEALNWLESVDYCNEVIDTYLMSADWDIEEGTYEDIFIERRLDK